MKKTISLLLAGASMTAAVSAQAQDSASDSGEIVVTAQKREQALSDVPMSVSAATGDQLIKQGVTSAADLGRIVPGFSYVESASSTPIYSLRGVGFNDTTVGARPTVSVYLDEAPLTFSVMSVGAQLDLERVEVLKGPQGTLFGQNATGGAINYIAAKPTTTFKAGFDASYGRFDTADVQGFVSGPITDTLSVRVAGRVLMGGDWQKSYTRDDSLGERYMRQGRIMLDWQPTDRLKVSLNVNGFVDKSDTPASQLIGLVIQSPANVGYVPDLISYPLAPEKARAADWTPGIDYARNNRFYQAIGRIDYDLTDDITLTSLTSYGHYKTDQTSDSDGTALFTWETNIKGKATTFNQEVRLAGLTGGLNWLVGASYARDKTFEDDFVPHPYSTGAYASLPHGITSSTGYRGAQDFKTRAVFGNLDYDLSDMFTLHAGARYTKTKLAYDSCNTGYAESIQSYTNFFNHYRAQIGLAPITTADFQNNCISIDANFYPGSIVGNLNEDNVSWRAGIDFKPSPDHMIYANVSRGYKSGSAPVSPSLLQSQFAPVTQEKLTAYELGFKSSFGRAIQINGAAFYYDYRDKQLKGRIATVPNIFGPLEALVNVPKSSITGGELQVLLRPAPGLTLNAGGTYLKTKIRGDFVNYTVLAQQANFRGEPFPYTPKWQGTADINYEFDISDDLEMFAGANVSYRSGTNASFGNAELLDIDAYALLDLRAGVQTRDGRWTLTAFGNNVTDKYYWTNVAKITDTVRRLPGMPATYGLRFSYRFN
ncbi:MAG: TonB-dependent receptor [Sphingobium sp.]